MDCNDCMIQMKSYHRDNSTHKMK